MKTKGSEVLSDIVAIRRNAEAKENAKAQELRRVENAIELATSKREAIYAELAEIYLDDKTSIEKLALATKELQAVFNQKRARRAKIEEELVTLEKTSKEHEDTLAQLTTELSTLGDDINEARAKVATELAKDQAYVEAATQAAILEKIVEVDNQRLQRITTECKTKLKDYDNEPLFVYLLNRGYGSVDYRAIPIIEYFDGVLAKMVDFAKSNANYRILKQLPERVGNACQERRTQLEKLQKSINQRRETAHNTNGLTDLLQTETIAEKRKKRILQEKQGVLVTISDIKKERAALDQNKDKFQTQAKQVLKSTLQDNDLITLKRRAEATPSPKDNQLVGQLEDIEHAIGIHRKEAKRIIQERDQLTEQTEKVARVERRFRDRDYDSSNSRFASGFDTQTLILGYLAGRLSDHTLDRQFEDNHSIYRPPAPSYSSSDSWGSRSSSSSSSWGSSSFGSGGGFGGGGHSTGGGF